MKGAAIEDVDTGRSYATLLEAKSSFGRTCCLQRNILSIFIIVILLSHHIIITMTHWIVEGILSIVIMLFEYSDCLWQNPMEPFFVLRRHRSKCKQFAAIFWQFFHLKMELAAWVIESSNDTSVRSMRNKTWWHCTLIGMPEHFDWGRCYGVTVLRCLACLDDNMIQDDLVTFWKKNFRFCEKASVLKESISFPVATENSGKKKRNS